MSDAPLPAARHDHRDVGALTIVGGFVGVLVGLGLVAASLFWIFPDIGGDHAIAPSMPVYPMPRLQTDPQAEWQAFREKELAELNSLTWRDKAKGLVHLPIDDAMRIVAARGIPDWPHETQK